MVLVAAFNRFRLLPLLDAGGGSRRSVLAWFRRTVPLEQALGLAVVLAASRAGDDQSRLIEFPRFAVRQCAISTGIVALASTWRVTPPSRNSRMRLWP